MNGQDALRHGAAVRISPIRTCLARIQLKLSRVLIPVVQFLLKFGVSITGHFLWKGQVNHFCFKT